MLYKPIEDFIKDEVKQINTDQHRRSGSSDPYTIGHYQGVIDGQKKAYSQILDEIKRLRRLL